MEKIIDKIPRKYLVSTLIVAGLANYLLFEDMDNTKTELIITFIPLAIALTALFILVKKDLKTKDPKKKAAVKGKLYMFCSFAILSILLFLASYFEIWPF